MPRARKPTGAELGAAALQRSADTELVLQITEDLRIDVGPVLKYNELDMVKLDQFAIGLLGDTSRNAPGDGILESRIRGAYLRAEVMLIIRKEIAALEA